MMNYAIITFFMYTYLETLLSINVDDGRRRDQTNATVGDGNRGDTT
jgi:hypothetical protein